MDAAARQALDALLTQAVADDVAPGVAAVVADGDGVVYEGAFGVADRRTGAAMRLDSIHGIASMTKLPTMILLMRLVERGAFALDTPVGDLLPAYDELPLLTGFDERGRPTLARPQRRATILHLITHTAGLGHPVWNARLARYFEAEGLDPAGLLGTAKAVSLPLVHEPGEAFDYGMGMDWAGLVIEAAVGRPYEVALHDEVLAPLGLRDTVVERSPQQLARTATVHVRDEDGRWEARDMGYYPPDLERVEVYSAGACLYSTPHDFLVLQRLLLGRGSCDGVTLLAPETVDRFFENHIGELEVAMPTTNPAASADVSLPGWKWGLGVLVNPTDRPAGRAAGSGGWAGGWNTFYWIDPRRQLAAGLYTQTLPFFDPGVMHCVERFEALVSA
jgi:methyl acetate hydrolase